jgi:hypothetical protein
MRKTHTGLELPDDTWRLYPIFHFDAPWEQGILRPLALDVRLIRADDTCLGQLKEHCDGVDVWYWMFDPRGGVVRWLLALRVPQASDHVPAQDMGFSFVERVEDAIAASFLACLKVLRSTPAVCPLSFLGKVDESTVEVSGHPPWDCATSADAPRCDWPEEFTEEDLRRLPEVWSGIVALRQLENWITRPFDSVFLSSLDRDAKEKAKREMRSRFRQTPSEIPEDTTEALIELFCRETGRGSPYGEALSSLFEEEEQKAFNIGTRIGRAVGIFEEGVHLPHLHAFLSVCLVLETLFTMGEGEVTHKLATRLAKVVVDKGTTAERLELFKRAKKVYAARSEVVHGKKAITDVSEEARKDAFNLTRKALQKILAERCHLDRYTAPVDKDGKGQLWDFFESLDLG